MISVVIPTYNRAQYLRKSLASLTNQKINFEVIVIDDGSTDSTKGIIEEFKNNLQLKYFYQDHRGVSVARNRGIAEAVGEAVVFFDDDALAADNWLAEIETIMKGENIITGSVRPIKNNLWQYFAPHYNQGDSPKESVVLLEGNCAMQKTVFDTIGKFNTNLTYGHEGQEFISRAKVHYKIMYYPQMVIYHDYAFGLINYLNKQYKFGDKMVYLKNAEIKSLKDLLLNYKKIKIGKEQGAKGERAKIKINLINKIMVALVARLGNSFHFLGAVVGYFKYHNKHDAQN